MQDFIDKIFPRIVNKYFRFATCRDKKANFKNLWDIIRHYFENNCNLVNYLCQTLGEQLYKFDE